MDPACTVPMPRSVWMSEPTMMRCRVGAVGPTTGVRVCKSHQHIKKGIMSNVTRVKGLIGQCIGLCLSAVHPLNTGHVCVDATVCVSVLPKTGKLTPAQCASLESLPALFVELHLPQCRITNGYGTEADMRT